MQGCKIMLLVLRIHTTARVTEVAVIVMLLLLLVELTVMMELMKRLVAQSVGD